MRRAREYPRILIEFREIKELGARTTGETNVPINGLVRLFFFFFFSFPLVAV